ncbi:MAG TPA: GMC family oxidoreductase [Vicinamibacterales bacterium]|jgi:choline dehydrogenase|nr:GMC family oxidoreductase [Vicinamibacterales bacterium]
MTCRECLEQSINVNAADLSPAAQQHLASCPDCARELSAPRGTSRGLGASRRGFLATTLAAAAAAVTASARRVLGASPAELPADAPIEYIVVGSGAGGGPLACNLARAGHKVVLFEAGGNNYPASAAIPLFTGPTSEDKSIRWDYWVRHYGNTVQQALDFKYRPDEDPDGTGGIWYPRVGAIGGCTIHSFLFAVYPSDSDWDNIADITGDGSWSAKDMRKYFERLEDCRYVPQKPGDPSRHGYGGWQPTEIASPSIFANDHLVGRFLQAALDELYHGAGVVKKKVKEFFGAELDPNDYRERNNRDGYYNIANLMQSGLRKGPREYILETAAALPNNLIIQADSLVTRVLFDGRTAIGIEYREGPRLYRADPGVTGADGTVKQMFMQSPKGEVILAAGAFNSPQILKLSGIGPADELRSHGITPLVDLPGVGHNLQDRYEVGIVTDMAESFSYLSTCTFFQGNDPCANTLFSGQGGPYSTVGSYGAFFQTTPTAKAAKEHDADLFIIAAAARFRGYYLNPDPADHNTTGYAELDINAHTNQHTWLILKAHTLNRAGTVTLRSADPRDTPVINFHYFDEGSDAKLQDLAAIVDGIELVRKMTARVADITAQGEVLPGPTVQSRAEIADFVRKEAWGHHASCTNKIGAANDPMAVLDSNFRVRGTHKLRVVDASSFPRIPGYFILMPIFMISEKATDVILADASV